MMLLECSLNGLVLVLVFSANWIKNMLNMGKWIKTTNMTAPNRQYIGYRICEIKKKNTNRKTGSAKSVGALTSNAPHNLSLSQQEPS